MCDGTENLEIEIDTLKEKNRILTMRVDELMTKFKNHINMMDAHEP